MGGKVRDIVQTFTFPPDFSARIYFGERACLPGFLAKGLNYSFWILSDPKSVVQNESLDKVVEAIR